ncbi:DUF3883 domain-containing protein [Mycoplasmatota bacterium WC30]
MWHKCYYNNKRRNFSWYGIRFKWVAEEADGYGYDVLSFDEDGNEKYIEVKGTTLMNTVPFYVTANELETSIEKGGQYWVYRVYYVNDSSPRFLKVNGSFERNFCLEPYGYKVYIKE